MGGEIEKREAAFNWLRNNDLGDIIKNEITVSFGRNEDNKAADYAVLAQGQGYQPAQKLKYGNLPEGWEAVHLSEVSAFENGDRSSNYPSGPDIKRSGIPFFNTKNIINHALAFSELDYITAEKFESLRSGKLRDRDILITLRGSVGKFGLFRASAQIATGFINAQLLIIRSIETRLVPFLMAFMKSEDFAQQISLLSSGAATPQLSAGKLANVLIPLPPLAEQRRIVAKVDALMALCDRLEAAIAEADETRARLLEALLHESLAEPDARLEAAE